MPRLGPFLCVTLLLIAATPAGTTPIRPDIRKLVSEPAENTIRFAPARAGWNGPETAQKDAALINPAAERLSPAATARAARQSLLAAAIPDWRVVLTIVGVIALLRFLRRKATSGRVIDSNEVPAEERLRPAA